MIGHNPRVENRWADETIRAKVEKDNEERSNRSKNRLVAELRKITFIYLFRDNLLNKFK